ncbi:MAG: hypothetical protein [Bacteriophage sp.]|nr:MAG: hypothetical protein [Bacteriophage sp.]
MEWQPIETAPKDGTVVDLYFPIKSYGDAILFGDGRMTNWSYEDGEWGSASGGLSRLVTATEKQPSHWMPIPKPPTEESA